MKAADLLARVKRRTQAVECPEFGEPLLVRSIGVAEMDTLVKAMDAAESDSEKVALQIAVFLSDDNGDALLTLDEARQVISKDWQVATRLMKAGNVLNGLSKADVENAAGN